MPRTYVTISISLTASRFYIYMCVPRAVQEPVASRVKGARKKRRSAPVEPLVEVQATQARRASFEHVQLDDNAEWKLFLATLDDDVGLAELFPESEDEEYCAPDDDPDDDSEELRNDRAVHIPRKEVAAIKRLADKNLDTLLGSLNQIDPTFLAGVRPPAARYVLNPAQRCALAGRVRDAVQLCAQMTLYSEDTRAAARPLLQALADKAHTSWLTCTLPDSRPSLFTPELKQTVAGMLTQAPCTSAEEVRRITEGWAWASRSLLLLGERKAMAERRSFMAVEDRLLVWGLRVFCPDGAIRRKQLWALIHDHCLPVWETRQIHLRYKNRSARHKPTNNIKEWRRNYVQRDAGPPDEAPANVFEVDVLHNPDDWAVDAMSAPPSPPPALPSAALSSDTFDVDMLGHTNDVCAVCIGSYCSTGKIINAIVRRFLNKMWCTSMSQLSFPRRPPSPLPSYRCGHRPCTVAPLQYRAPARERTPLGRRIADLDATRFGGRD